MDYEFYLLNLIQQHVRNDFFDVLMPLVSMLGKAAALWVIIAAVLLCFKKTRTAGRSMAWNLASGGALLMLTVKPIVNRIRPYVLNDTVYPVTISENEAVIEVEIINEYIRGNVKTTKVDKDYPDNKLTGAVFEIYSDTNEDEKLDRDDTLVGELKESDAGIYEMNDLVYGHYLVKEKTAPDGFILDENTYPVFIETDGKTYEVENEAGKGFLNEAMKGSLKIIKTSSDKKVEGISFRITGENGFDQTVKTDKNGEILIEGLRIGKYLVSEVNNEASAGYLLPEDEVVEIEYGKTATVKMHNEKIDVPQTGDFRTPNSFWLALGSVAAAGIAVCVVLLMRKKKKTNKEAE